jgi:hypothetical protein
MVNIGFSHNENTFRTASPPSFKAWRDFLTDLVMCRNPWSTPEYDFNSLGIPALLNAADKGGLLS